MFRRAAIALAVVCLLGVAVVAVRHPWLAGRSPDRAITHEEGEGPLSVSMNSGISESIRFPGRRTDWHAYFGSFVLCSHDTSGTATLTRVRVTGHNVEGHVRTVLRTTSLSDVRAPRGQGGPVLAAKGSPPDFSEGYSDARLTGTFSTRLDGTRISKGCRSRDLYTHGYRSLMITADVPPEGIVVRGIRIDYRFGGKYYSLRITPRLAFCGTRYRIQACSGHV